MTNVTFPQLIQRGCGIDVHLKVVEVTINGVGIHKEISTFHTFTSCLTEMKEWLLANGITHVAMESTGVEFKKLVYKVSLEKKQQNLETTPSLVDFYRNTHSPIMKLGSTVKRQRQ